VAVATAGEHCFFYLYGVCYKFFGRQQWQQFWHVLVVYAAGVLQNSWQFNQWFEGS
jgi:hypothetical protein